MIAFSCSACQKKLSVKDELAGKKGKCPGCGQPVAVPGPPPPAQAAPWRSPPPSQRGRTPRPSHLGQPFHRRTRPTGEDTRPRFQPDRFPGPAAGRRRAGPAGQVPHPEGAGPRRHGRRLPGRGPQARTRKVALKAMLPALAASASAGKRFLREAQAMAAVEHDHIVTIYQVGEDRGVPFLAMEFLKGEPLDERLKREEKLPAGRGAAHRPGDRRGPGAAHATGLIHRDIKPANIWLEAPRGPGQDPRLRPGPGGVAGRGPDAAGRASSARRRTWPPSRAAARRSTPAATCSAWAAGPLPPVHGQAAVQGQRHRVDVDVGRHGPAAAAGGAERRSARELSDLVVRASWRRTPAPASLRHGGGAGAGPPSSESDQGGGTPGRTRSGLEAQGQGEGRGEAWRTPLMIAAAALALLAVASLAAVHGGAYPHRGPIDAALAGMTDLRDNYDIVAWKIYTMVPTDSHFYFDDHDPTRPADRPTVHRPRPRDRSADHLHAQGHLVDRRHDPRARRPERHRSGRGPQPGHLLRRLPLRLRARRRRRGRYDPNNTAPEGVDRLIRSLQQAQDRTEQQRVRRARRDMVVRHPRPDRGRARAREVAEVRR